MTQLPDFSVKPVLAGEKALLRPFRADDLPAICAVLLDPEARILTGGVQNEAEKKEAGAGRHGAPS